MKMALRVNSALAVLEILMIFSLHSVNSRTFPDMSSKLTKQFYDNLYKDGTQEGRILKDKSERRLIAKDHLNSVLPLAYKTVGRGGRALTELPEAEEEKAPKECNGTSSKLNTRFRDVSRRYEFYQMRYTGCEVVNGNLEIVFLHDQKRTYDMSFLKDIREVTGYVLIAVVFAKTIPLTNLQVIRGETLYSGSSLYVTLNYIPTQADFVGLWELQMPSLTEISRGDVVFRRNNYLCFTDTIVWGDIMKQPDSRIHRRKNRVGIVRACNACSENCHDHCWGEGENMCQADRTHVQDIHYYDQDSFYY